jgi:hypothetical protein
VIPARALQHLDLAERAFLEVFGERIVVGLGGRFDELLAIFIRRAR